MNRQLAIRWTVGDVSTRGFDALELSVRGITALFGASATYVISVNTVPVEAVQRRLGELAEIVSWHQADGHAPRWLTERYLDQGWAEGVAWKFAPVRLYPDRHELSLDNDVILWSVPPSIQDWLADGDSTLIAEDVRPAFGAFAPWCPDAGRNSGIRGLPPGFYLEGAMRERLESNAAPLRSELDEQGLQVAVLTSGKHRVTTLDEVTICSPTPPHLCTLGACGAHFVGVNAKKLPWEWNGKSGERHVQEFWDGMVEELRSRVESAARDGAYRPVSSFTIESAP